MGSPASLCGWPAVFVKARILGRLVGIALRTRGPVGAVTALWRLRALARAHLWDATRGHRARAWTPRLVAASGRHFWALHAPGFPSPAFDAFCEGELARVAPKGLPPPLNAAILALTKRCALSCEHCFEWDALNRPESLSSEDLRAIMGRLLARGVVQVYFSGGEPLTRFDDLSSLTRQASPHADCWLLSSGLGLTAERARRLREAGLTGIALSLDHWNPAEHDRFRGMPGAFDGVERAARHARDAGLVVALSLCPTRDFVTAGNLERYAGVAMSLGASFIQILEPKAVGHLAGQDVVLRPDQQRELELFCLRLDRSPPDRGLPTTSYMDWVSRARGCDGAGDRYLYIDTDGDVHPCPFCRAPGLSALDRDLDAALDELACAGCPAAGAAACSVHPRSEVSAT